ncbi:MAG: ABC transporter ATP-binding protein [Pseudomonadota bacterium]
MTVSETASEPSLKAAARRLVPTLEGRPALLIRLFREAGMEHWKGYAMAFGLMGVIAGTTGLSAWVMRDVINEIFVEGRGELVVPIAGAVAFIFIVKGVATYFNSVILNRIGNAIVAKLQMRLFDHVLGQRVDFFDRFPVGDVATRLSHNARAGREALNLVITRLGRDLLSVIVLGLVMVLQNPELSAIALLGAPPAIWGLNKLVKRIKKVAKAEFLGLAQIVTTVQETGGGLRVIKAFGLEGRMRGQMDDAVEGVRKRADAIATISAAPIPLMETVAGLAIAAVILYAGHRVTDGTQDPGAFFAFLTALLLAYDPARRVAQLNVVLHAHLVGVEIMYSMLDRPTRLREKPGAEPLPEGPGRIALEGVRFTYGDHGEVLPWPDPAAVLAGKAAVPDPAPEAAPDAAPETAAAPGTAPAPSAGAAPPDPDDELLPEARAPLLTDGPPALAGLDLVAEAGQVTALVGPSGAGKSTVFQLIERFYDPEEGRVAIDGHDIAGVTLDSLRARIAYVSQDAFLFDGTVAENIDLGRPKGAPPSERETIIAAARAANAHSFIEALAEGYDTPLGENGARLSGGQRQRLSIARAMLRSPQILLLDEPTSALDAEAEAHVAEALERLMKGRTVLVIAHRFSTIRSADMIHAMEAGRVVESGTHTELLAKGGLYARLHAFQFGQAAPAGDATVSPAP